MRKPPRGSLLNRTHPLARNLIGCWLMNEGTGDLACDLSGHGNHGCLASMDPPTDWVAGPFGFALDLDGLNDRVAVADSASLQVRGDMSIEVRVWFDSLEAFDTLVSKDLVSSNRSFDFRRTTSGRIEFYAFKAVDYSHWRTDINVVSADTWHHLVVAYDNAADDAAFYVDGQPVSSSPVTLKAGAIAAGASPLWLGGRPNGANYLGGMVAYARMWNRTLGREEVLGLHRDPVAMFGCPAPVWLPSALEALGPTAFRNRTEGLTFADSTERLSFRDATQRIEPVSDVS